MGFRTVAIVDLQLAQSVFKGLGNAFDVLGFEGYVL